MNFKVAFLFDKSNNWLSSYFSNYRVDRSNVEIKLFFDAEEIENYDVVFILGYTKILPKDFLLRNGLNLVVHGSDLPKGKGFAPIQWQLLEGKDEIKISLIEALENVDSGDVLLQDTIYFDGTELYEKIREKQVEATIKIVTKFINLYPNYDRKKQVGEESFYPKRTTLDGELDIKKSIIDNFNLLRIGNNDGWPSFFHYKGKKYVLKIFDSI